MKSNKSFNNLIILVLIILFFAPLQVGVLADTFYVEIDGSDTNDGSSSDSEDAFQTIQGAIDNDSVDDDDTIYVGEGTFTESIIITKSVTIYGDGKNSTYLKPLSSDDTVFTVSVDDVSIKYLTISGADNTDATGIYVESGVEDFSLTYCELTENYIGCYLNETDDATIYDTDFTDNEIGMYLNTASDTSVTGCEFEENTKGIVAISSEIDSISNNDFEENDYGIYLDDSEDYYSSDDSNDLKTNNDYEDSIEEDVYIGDDEDDISCFITTAQPDFLRRAIQYFKARLNFFNFL